MKDIILLVSILFYTSIQAQTLLQGRMTNQENGEALGGVYLDIYVGEVNVKNKRSDRNGNYSINLDPGTYELSIKYLGFEKKRITGVAILKDQITKLDIQLSPKQGFIKDIKDYKGPVIQLDGPWAIGRSFQEQISKVQPKKINQLPTNLDELSEADEGDDVTIYGARESYNSYPWDIQVLLPFPEDGLYRIERFGTNKNELLPLNTNEALITFNSEFLDKTDQTKEFLVINTLEFAPLSLAKKPETEPHKDNRKKLLLTLSKDGKEKLKAFTSKNLNRHAAIIVGGEALTKHKIKAVIEEGLLQITRCTDNACELLYTELQDNVVNE